MIRKKTTLILGAGASRPYGFPTGGELVDRICSLSRDYQINTPGYPATHREPYPKHDSFSMGKLEDFQRDLRDSKLLSIDVFLGHVYDLKPEYVTIGKAAIAATLIPLEDPANLQNNVQGDWCAQLISLMGANYDQLLESAANLSVVTFNYDRSFEYYLFNALKSIHGEDKAIELIKIIQPLHVYGQLCLPHFLIVHGGREYSPNLDNQIVATCAQELKVIPDTADNSAEFKKARARLAKTENICFLGFGFDELNIKRLGVKKPYHAKAVFATAFHLSGIRRKTAQSYFGPDGIQFGSDEDDALSFLHNNDVFGLIQAATKIRTKKKTSASEPMIAIYPKEEYKIDDETN